MNSFMGNATGLMKTFFVTFFGCVVWILIIGAGVQSHALHTKMGFSLPDSVKEFTLSYNTIDGLIILPVVVNDSVRVNLILDTGCRNVLLFGKQFQKIFSAAPNRTIEFSGMGSGSHVKGNVHLDNGVTIGLVKGEHMPIVVVPERNVFRRYHTVDGLIGYEIFTKFEIEIHPAQHLITFRSAFNNSIPEGYTKIPMTIVASKPILHSSITLTKETLTMDLLIDTGSTLGLLLKSTDESRFGSGQSDVIGKGLNGLIKGISAVAQHVKLGDFEFTGMVAGIIHSPWHNYASIGMDVLKDYSIILNYAQSFACLKKESVL